MNTSYKNDPKLKKDFLREVKKPREADAIEKGHYGKLNGQWRGCSVACSLRSLKIIKGEALTDDKKYDDHKELAKEIFGSEKLEWLAQLQDTLFENLPEKEALKWTEQFAQAIPVGANVEPVKWHFGAYLMRENIDRVLKLKIDEDLKEQVVKAIQEVLAVHEKAIETGEWDESAAELAEFAARSAAESAEFAEFAARSAAWSAAEAARSAAWSAAEAAESAEFAAWSAAWSAAEFAARSAAYKRYAQELLRLLKEVK